MELNCNIWEYEITLKLANWPKFSSWPFIKCCYHTDNVFVINMQTCTIILKFKFLNMIVFGLVSERTLKITLPGITAGTTYYVFFLTWRISVFFVRLLVPLFWTSGNVFIWILISEWFPSLHFLLHFLQQQNLQIHLWCNTCWPIGGQYDSRAILVNLPVNLEWLFSWVFLFIHSNDTLSVRHRCC